MRGARQGEMALHGPKPPRGPRTFDAFTGWQFLVDDYAIDRWTNVLRVLNKPTDKRVALRPEATRRPPRGLDALAAWCAVAGPRLSAVPRGGLNGGSNHGYPEWWLLHLLLHLLLLHHLLSTFFTSLLRHIGHQAFQYSFSLSADGVDWRSKRPYPSTTWELQHAA